MLMRHSGHLIDFAPDLYFNHSPVFVSVFQGYALCPYCYSHPPFKEMKKGMGCNECTHPSCPNSLAVIGVSSCVECDAGTLVLDPMSAPKWRIVCNRSVVAITCEPNY
jgi:DNA topoisomerase-3